MKLIGLTGSIGMGKSTVAQMFAEEGAAIYDADAAVHMVYAPGGAAVGPVSEAFPGALKEGGIDRAALSAQVLNNPDALKKLESIVHPIIRGAQIAFLAEQRAAGAAFVVLDIPLLLEHGRPNSLDAVVVVSAPAAAQRERVLARPGMSEEKFVAILARQMPDADKRKLADFVIETGGSFDDTRAQVRAVLDALREPA